MTVSPPNSDPKLKGHAAVLIDGVVHAVTNSYEGEWPTPDTMKPECQNSDKELDSIGFKSRRDYLGEKMCEECWPDSILDSQSANVE